MKEILITSSVLIVVLLILRAVFANKVRRTLIYGTWLLVALRLLIPVQFGELSISVLNLFQPVTQTITDISDKQLAGVTEQDAYRQVMQEYIEQDQTVFLPERQEQIQSALDEQMPKDEIATMLDKTLPEEEIYVPEVRPQVQAQVEKTADPITLGQILWAVWGLGAVAVAIWLAVSNLRFVRAMKKTATAISVDSPIPVYVTEKAVSPCLVGLFRPAVYLTPEAASNENLLRYVMTHELTHYAHKDYIWSAVRCLCLCLYWFNPLVWVAAWCSRRDCELACDEGAMARLGEEQRIPYGKALLAVVQEASVPSRLMFTATTMAESKRQLRRRVNFIARKPHLSLFAAIALVLVCTLVVGCVATGAKPQTAAEDPIIEGPAITEPTESTGETTTPTESSTPTGTATPTDSTEPSETVAPTNTGAPTVTPTDSTEAPETTDLTSPTEATTTPSATTTVPSAARPTVNIVTNFTVITKVTAPPTTKVTEPATVKPTEPATTVPTTAPTTPTATTVPTGTETKPTYYGPTLPLVTPTITTKPVSTGETKPPVYTSNLTYQVNSDGKTCTVTGLASTDTNVLIPATIDGYAVTAIGRQAFWYATNLRSVSLSNGLTSIGYEAFARCTSLQSIILPDSVTDIGTGAFSGCTALTKAVLPKGLTEIPSQLFFNCYNLTEAPIPDSVTEIGINAFSGCSKLKEFIIPSGITTITQYAFQSCGFERIVIPEGVTVIEQSAFSSSHTLKEVVIPDTVTVIKAEAFFNCSKLEKVVLPKGLKEISSSLFSNCDALKEIVIPDGVTRICRDAFSACNVLEQVHIPSSVTVIEDDAFFSCPKLKEIHIPEGVAEIHDSAFQNCSALQKVYLPQSLTDLNAPFEFCPALETVYYNGTKDQWIAIQKDGALSDRPLNIQYAN